MRPVLIEIGFLHIYGYGLMLVLGFLSGIYLARRRARKAVENPDHITQCGLLALAGGVVGSRAAYILQHWDSQFARVEDKLPAMVNITSGGLIYYGGVILAAILVVGYLLAKRLPARRFLDIIVISAMIGLAFGRAGCLLNGCCFGAPCQAAHWLGQRFPMYAKPLLKVPRGGNPYANATQTPTPVYEHQFRLSQLRPDERLVLLEPTESHPLGVPVEVHPPRYLHGALANDQLAVLADEPGWERSFPGVAGADGRIDQREWKAGLAVGQGLLRGSENWNQAMVFDVNGDRRLSRGELAEYFRFTWTRLLAQFDGDDDRKLTGAEYARANAYLQADQFALAADYWARPVVPAQALGIVNALLVAAVLSVVYRLRHREGQVTAAAMIAYPLVRFLEESVRGDNAHDLAAAVLTHNQITSLVLLVLGVGMLVSLRWMPAASASRAGQTKVSHSTKTVQKIS
jgi:prolipoprotein diacylglyceryltransferase